MELMILRMNKTKNEYYAGFNRPEWLSFDGAVKYNEFREMIGYNNQGYFDEFEDGYMYGF